MLGLLDTYNNLESDLNLPTTESSAPTMTSSTQLSSQPFPDNNDNDQSSPSPAVLSSHAIINDTSSSSPNVIDSDPNFFHDTIHHMAHEDTSVQTPLSIQPQPIRKSTRYKNPPTRYNSYTPYPLSHSLSYENCSPSYRKFCCTISSVTDPKTYLQASKHDCWRKVMDVVILALKENQTWTLVDLTASKVPVRCKWVYKIKYHVDSSI